MPQGGMVGNNRKYVTRRIYVITGSTSQLPALLALQQLPVGGDLHVQRHLDVLQFRVLLHLLVDLSAQAL